MWLRILSLVALLCSATAFAYVLPAYSILRRLVERRDDMRLSGLQVTGTATFPADAKTGAAGALGVPPERDVQADATFSLKIPGRCRVDLKVPEGNVAATTFAYGKKRVEGKEIAAVTAALAQACPVLALRSASEGEARESLERQLRALGVDLKPTSLGRFGGKIAYVIGKPAAGEPQFWVYKDTFLPARVLFKDAEGAQWDVRMVDFGSAVTGDWFPRVLEVRKNDEVAMRFTALGANAAVKLDDKLFAAP